MEANFSDKSTDTENDKLTNIESLYFGPYSHIVRLLWNINASADFIAKNLKLQMLYTTFSLMLFERLK